MMVTWTRGRTVAAGLALIVLTNAIALGGAAWNRSGEPESKLTLTQRELWQFYPYSFDRDGDGMEVKLRWRTLPADPAAVSSRYRGGTPHWMNAATLASLGFDVSAPPAAWRAGRRYERQLPREALLVLELDGPAYRKALERARERAQDEAEKAKQTGKTGPGTPVHNAATFLKQEEEENSRLFVVDAGLSPEALRAKYPDRTRYAIVRGSVRAYYQSRRTEPGWTGYMELKNASLNVPHEFHSVIASASLGHRMAAAGNGALAVEVTVAFGKRFEPWILDARPSNVRRENAEGGTGKR